MVYIAICIFVGVATPQLLRLAQHGPHSKPAIGFLAFCFAAAYSLVGFLPRQAAWSAMTDAPVLLWAVASGLSAFVSMILVLACLARAGVGVTAATISLSVIVVAVVAWLIWDDPLGPPQWVGLALLVPAVVLLRPGDQGSARLTWQVFLLLLALCLIGALSNTTHKAVAAIGPDGYEPAYQLVRFSTASLASLVLLLCRRHTPGRREIAVGAAVGLCFAGAQLATLLALGEIPATIFYPTTGTAPIALNLIIAHRLWHERLLRRQIGGIVLAIVVVLLTNLR